MKRLISLLVLLPALAFGQIQFNEDDPEQSPQTGPVCLSVRRDTAASSAGTSGDYATLNTDASGKLWVNAAGTGAAGDITKVEDAAYGDGDKLVGIALCRNNTAARNVDGSTDYMCMQGDTDGKLWITGTAVEDSGLSSGATLIVPGLIRDDALQNTDPGTELDLGFFRSDAYGALWTHPLTSTTVLTDTAVIEAAAYASGDCIMAAAESLTGTAATAPFLTGRITDVVITDLAAQAANIDVIFFNADPGNVCAAINAAADVDDDDLAKVIGVVHVVDHIALNDNSISEALNQNMKYALASGTTLYYALVSRGTPTYGGTSDLVIRVKVELD